MTWFFCVYKSCYFTIIFSWFGTLANPSLPSSCLHVCFIKVSHLGTIKASCQLCYKHYIPQCENCHQWQGPLAQKASQPTNFYLFLCDCKIFSTFEVGRSSMSKLDSVSNRSFNTTTFANNLGQSMHELLLELEICLVLEIKQLHEKMNQ
jgi:hypothetical protein